MSGICRATFSLTHKLEEIPKLIRQFNVLEQEHAQFAQDSKPHNLHNEW